MEPRIYTSLCEEETFRLGVDIASDLCPGDTVAFFGDLGAGKTQFIKGVCQGLNVEDLVSSPTFTIVNQYTGAQDNGEEVTIYHIDLYRIEEEKDLEEIGLPETLADPLSIKLIEWSEHGMGVLPEDRIDIRFTTLDDQEDCRQIEVYRSRVPEGTVDALM